MAGSLLMVTGEAAMLTPITVVTFQISLLRSVQGGSKPTQVYAGTEHLAQQQPPSRRSGQDQTVARSRAELAEFMQLGESDRGDTGSDPGPGSRN